MATVPRDFIEFVTPWGKVGPEFLAYGVRPRYAPPIPAPRFTEWPRLADVAAFLLDDEESPIVAHLWQVSLESVPDELGSLLGTALNELLKAGAEVACWMLDATFGGFSPMFDVWVAQRTYGLAFGHFRGRIALESAARSSDYWIQHVMKAQSHLDRISHS